MLVERHTEVNLEQILMELPTQFHGARLALRKLSSDKYEIGYSHHAWFVGATATDAANQLLNYINEKTK